MDSEFQYSINDFILTYHSHRFLMVKQILSVNDADTWNIKYVCKDIAIVAIKKNEIHKLESMQDDRPEIVGQGEIYRVVPSVLSPEIVNELSKYPVKYLEYECGF